MWRHSFSYIQSVVHRIQNTFKRNKRILRKGLWTNYRYRVCRSNYTPIKFCPSLRWFARDVCVLLRYYIVDSYSSISFRYKRRPAVDTSTSRPTVDNSIRRPAVDTSTSRPAVDTSTSRPTVDNFTRRPDVDTSAGRPAVDTSNRLSISLLVDY